MKRRAEVGRNGGILIIDEGDDLGMSRAEMQAHHEDRAGLNVLIKEINRLARDRARIAVVLVTNRVRALDPALIRRAQVILFTRPNAEARRGLFEQLLLGVEHNAKMLPVWCVPQSVIHFLAIRISSSAEPRLH